MRPKTAILTLLIGATLGCAYPLSAQSTSMCKPADASSAKALVTLKNLVTTTDSTDVAYRNSLSIPATQATNVSFLTDSKTCQKGVDAYNAWANTPAAARKVWAYKIDQSFAVEDPTFGTGGEYRSLLIFDRHWAYKGTMLTF
jgi:hypothetical protein